MDRAERVVKPCKKCGKQAKAFLSLRKKGIRTFWIICEQCGRNVGDVMFAEEPYELVKGRAVRKWNEEN